MTRREIPQTQLDALRAGQHNGINDGHIFSPDRNTIGRPTGYHSETLGAPSDPDFRVLERRAPGGGPATNIDTTPYHLRFKLDRTTSAGNVVEARKWSTMFPRSWSRTRVLDEIRGAFANIDPSTLTWSRRGGPNLHWEGVSPDGLRIGGYLNPDGTLASAFPLIGPR